MSGVKNSRSVYLIGNKISDLNAEVLPSNKDVLSFYFYLTKVKKKTATVSLNEVVSKCQMIFKKHDLKYERKDYSIKKLKNLLKQWLSLSKSKTRKSEVHTKNEKKFI